MLRWRTKAHGKYSGSSIVPFVNGRCHFKDTRIFLPVIESVSIKKKENRNPDIEPGPLTTLTTTLSLTTTLRHQPRQNSQKLKYIH